MAWRNLPVIHSLIRDVMHWRTDGYVISYPKCGRTWLRVAMGKALALRYGSQDDNLVNLVERGGVTRAPRIRFTHDGSDLPPGSIVRDECRYRHYRRKPVVVLARDPRDVLVSYYFHRTRREKESYEMSEFLRHPWWGIDRILSFYRGWYEHRETPRDFMLLRYEDMHAHGVAALSEVFRFFGEPVDDGVIEAAFDYASFENMRRLATRENAPERLRPTDPEDPESHKVRRGLVAGHLEYLAASDIAYLNERIRQSLPDAFGYTGGGWEGDKYRGKVLP